MSISQNNDDPQRQVPPALETLAHCNVCLDVMWNPVLLASCGHSFCEVSCKKKFVGFVYTGKMVEVDNKLFLLL